MSIYFFSVFRASQTLGRKPCLGFLLGQGRSGTQRSACDTLLPPSACWEGTQRFYDTSPHLGGGPSPPLFFNFRHDASCVLTCKNITLHGFFLIKTIHVLCPLFFLNHLESINICREEGKNGL